MVLIKGGTFNMGTDDPDPILANAKPVHSVTLSKDFCMDEHEFTNRDKGMSVFAGFTWPPVYGDSNFTHDNQPLINVNWNEAKAICEKQGKRLPTEAEWEYAAKGGANEYEYGTSDGSLTDNNACWKKTKTCDVMSYQPNIFGLYDMSGNVWEWVSDWYGDYKSTAVTDPTGPLSGTYRVFRGGSWGSVNPGFLRAAIRYYDYPGLRRYGIGFRCVAAPQDSKK
jgi:formylglycine-generating enzyme required for sulfatase activity